MVVSGEILSWELAAACRSTVVNGALGFCLVSFVSTLRISAVRAPVTAWRIASALALSVKLPPLCVAVNSTSPFWRVIETT
jgi:hypothetical protein